MKTQQREVKLVTDTLVVVDHIISDFTMDGADVHVLSSTDGLGKVLELLRVGFLKVDQYKFLILLCGKVDLVELDVYFRESLLGIVDFMRSSFP